MNYEGKSYLELASTGDPQTIINKDDIAANSVLIANNTTAITHNSAALQFGYVELWPSSPITASTGVTTIFAADNHNPFYFENTGYIGAGTGQLQFQSSSEFVGLQSVPPSTPIYGLQWNKPVESVNDAVFHIKGKISYIGASFPFQLTLGLRIVGFTIFGETHNTLYNPRQISAAFIPIVYYEIDTFVTINVFDTTKLQFYMSGSTTIPDWPLTFVVGGDVESPNKSLNSLYVKRIR